MVSLVVSSCEMDCSMAAAAKKVTEDEQRARRAEWLKNRFAETILRAGEKKSLCDLEHENRMVESETKMRRREEDMKMQQWTKERKTVRIKQGKIKKTGPKNDSNQPLQENKNLGNTLSPNFSRKTDPATPHAQDNQENVPQARAIKTPDQDKEAHRKMQRSQEEREKNKVPKNDSGHALQEIKNLGDTLPTNLSRKRALATLYAQENKENVPQAEAMKITDNEKQEQIKRQQRQKEREVARITLEKMERTVFFNDFDGITRDLKNMGCTITPSGKLFVASAPETPYANNFEKWVQQMQEEENKMEERQKAVEVEETEETNDFFEALQNLENVGYTVTWSRYSPLKEISENSWNFSEL